MPAKTLFDKIWDKHEVMVLEDGSSVLYIDRHYVHEVTSPQAFEGLRNRNLKVFRPERTFATMDHNVPTINQGMPIKDPQSRKQVSTLERNTAEFGIPLYSLNHPWNGIVHVIGPELGLTRPGMTIVCGDSHTSTHGAFGTIAFGIGTSEVEMVLASQCLVQQRPKTMKIEIEGKLGRGVYSKDLALFILSRIGTNGGTGHFIEFAGPAIEALSMEGRMSLCNMSIEMGARGGFVAPDQKAYDYLKDREFSPSGDDWEKLLSEWKGLYSDPDAVFDKYLKLDASEISPMITFGTNPGMGIPVDGKIPDPGEMKGSQKVNFLKSLEYMGLEGGKQLRGTKVDYVFLGSCTNGRIEDIRAFAGLVRGRKKADSVTALIVPGSKQVEEQARKEGLDKILNEAGFELRQPGCSACLAMNDDRIPAGKYCVSTSNRNFEGRQGPGARTFLASPVTAAAAAITGEVSDPRDFID
jgi:3-isopropylmalate/(R)-2-methylmalate dehydratase large subunit